MVKPKTGKKWLILSAAADHHIIEWLLRISVTSIGDLSFQSINYDEKIF